MRLSPCYKPDNRLELSGMTRVRQLIAFTIQSLSRRSQPMPLTENIFDTNEQAGGRPLCSGTRQEDLGYRAFSKGFQQLSSLADTNKPRYGKYDTETFTHSEGEGEGEGEIEGERGRERGRGRERER